MKQLWRRVRAWLARKRCDHHQKSLTHARRNSDDAIVFEVHHNFWLETDCAEDVAEEVSRRFGIAVDQAAEAIPDEPIRGSFFEKVDVIINTVSQRQETIAHLLRRPLTTEGIE